MKIFYWTVAILIFIVGAFVGLNAFIYEEKQDEVTIPFRDGKYLGFVHALVDDNTALDFDDATWLSGKAGQDAAIEAGLCTKETRQDCLPNDYFIKNATPKDERLSLDPDALIFMQTWKMEETGQVQELEIGLTDFSALINTHMLHWNKLPYTVTVAGGVVTRIEEIYVP